MSGRQYKEAMENIVLALRLTESKHLGKLSHLNKWKSCLSESIEKIFTIETALKSSTFSKSTYEFCKELCYQIKPLHKHEVDLLKAQMYWKLNQKQRALKKLFGVSGISTVKMSAYFLLLKYLKQLGNFKCLKTVACEMIEKCKNPQVPSYVWAKANLAYAKALALNEKPGKAILILKCMAKLLPPLPFVNVNFTKFLQRAKSIQDLAQARSESIETMNAYSFVMSANNLRDFSQKVISEEIRVSSQNNNKKLARTNTQLFGSFRRYKKQQTLEVKESEEAKESTLLGVSLPNLVEFRGFSICSCFKFLYRIGTVALKFRVNLQDGVAAIDDYLELLDVEKDLVFRERCRAKALGVRQKLMEKV
jgi:tetratricopeptide (TPR) repeat protein